MKNVKINILKILKKSGDFTEKELALIALKMATSDVVPMTYIAPAIKRAEEKGKTKVIKRMCGWLSPNELDSEKGKIIRDFLNKFLN